MRGEMQMPEETTQTETVETTETETVETTETETPENKAEETVEKPETETVETKEETTETAEETKEDSTKEETDETPEDTDADDAEESKTNDELVKLDSKYKAEVKKVESLKGQVKELESVVKTILDAKVAEIPKEFQALIPDGNVTKQLEWVNKAEASGLFKKPEVKDVEIGKPLELGNKDHQKANSNLTGQQKLANYFSNHFSKQ